MSNKTLGIIFGVLLALFLLLKLLGGNKERSFDPQIIELDTTKITRIEIEPKGESSSFSLQKQGPIWKIITEGNEYTATRTAVTSLYSNILDIEADRIVSKNPEKWSAYEVDKNGTRIQFYAGDRLLEDLRVGRFSFNQATRAGISYYRIEGSDEVYSSNGFGAMSLGQGIENYRDKTLLSLNKNDLKEIVLREGGTQISLTKQGTQWLDVSHQPIDSSKVDTYLNNVQSVSAFTFADEKESGEALKSISFDGDNLENPVRVFCYPARDTSQLFLLHSESNPEGFFYSDSTGAYERIFNKFYDIFENTE